MSRPAIPGTYVGQPTRTSRSRCALIPQVNKLGRYRPLASPRKSAATCGEMARPASRNFAGRRPTTTDRRTDACARQTRQRWGSRPNGQDCLRRSRLTELLKWSTRTPRHVVRISLASRRSPRCSLTAAVVIPVIPAVPPGAVAPFDDRSEDLRRGLESTSQGAGSN